MVSRTHEQCYFLSAMIRCQVYSAFGIAIDGTTPIWSTTPRWWWFTHIRVRKHLFARKIWCIRGLVCLICLRAPQQFWYCKWGLVFGAEWFCNFGLNNATWSIRHPSSWHEWRFEKAMYVLGKQPCFHTLSVAHFKEIKESRNLISLDNWWSSIACLEGHVTCQHYRKSVSISGDISSQLHGGYAHPLARSWQAESGHHRYV